MAQTPPPATMILFPADELADALSHKLEDVSGTRFTQTQKFRALNNGQFKLCKMLNSKYLDELSTSVVRSMHSNPNDISDLDLLNGQLSIINIRLIGGGVAMPIADLKEVDTYFGMGTNENPKYHVLGSKLYFFSRGVVSPVIEIHYIKTPTELSVNGNVFLRKSLRHLIVGFAEAELWEMDDEQKRRSSALDNVLKEIEYLNTSI